ncbi:hypothetical protein RZS08_53265, partial [Arthrospira platensis SPKY1]|nr:hypothetical protein [Arthrospira platensis SPKY1]
QAESSGKAGAEWIRVIRMHLESIILLFPGNPQAQQVHLLIRCQQAVKLQGEIHLPIFGSPLQPASLKLVLFPDDGRAGELHTGRLGAQVQFSTGPGTIQRRHLVGEG